jgi:hypothetical protein
VTPPSTRATRRCAAHSCGQIEFVPSRRLAAAWLFWLALCVLTLLTGVSLPWPVRIALSAGLVTANLRGLRAAVLLRGPRGIRGLRWREDGRFRLRAAPGQPGLSATLQPASFRLGSDFLVLWFATPSGSRTVVVDARRQDPVPFRRLCRHLARGELLPSRPKV